MDQIKVAAAIRSPETEDKEVNNSVQGSSKSKVRHPDIYQDTLTTNDATASTNGCAAMPFAMEDAGVSGAFFVFFMFL
ncbi:hypothetical protein Bpse01_12710 [Bifidobacterium pseudocatenulatum]|nr:hypothetical protein Bpse01_12710 [Bifidobacterium pseudocatenulatum]